MPDGTPGTRKSAYSQGNITNQWATGCTPAAQRGCGQLQRCVENYRSISTLYKIMSFFLQTELKLQLQEAEEQRALNEIKMRERITSLMKEKDKFLCLSMERGKVIQVNKKTALLTNKHTQMLMNEWMASLTYKLLLNAGETGGNPEPGDKMQRREESATGGIGEVLTVLTLHCSKTLKFNWLSYFLLYSCPRVLALPTREVSVLPQAITLKCQMRMFNICTINFVMLLTALQD